MTAGINTRNEANRSGILSPVIVTASRATDLPAFHADWLVNRLRAGWCGWVNPFNGRAYRVSFEATRAFVFFTKNPVPLLDRLDEWERRGLGFYFHMTLNDYDREGFEPGVPPLERRVEAFAALAARVGPERAIWRFDPLLITDRTPPEALLDKVRGVGRALAGRTRKLVISFADLERYPRVRRNLAAAGIRAREFTAEERRTFARALAGAGLGLELGACAEEDDFSAYGIAPAKCVDDALLRRLYPRDAALMAFLGPGGRLKDRGQRRACSCVTAKDIGRYTTCPHGCLYCYANASPDQARRHYARCSPDHPALCGGIDF